MESDEQKAQNCEFTVNEMWERLGADEREGENQEQM